MSESLVWKNLSYVLPPKKKTTAEKFILYRMNGQVSSGETVAILGGSGAGKSSLLNCISGRLTSGAVFGEISYNGRKRDPATWKKQVSYVEQDDLMFPNLTVFETLMYSARLRLPKSISRQEKTAVVDRIIEELGLGSCKNTRIGNRDNRGISGGERKRVSIGIELVTDPKILFLDEPSSGLDAFNALNTLSIVKNLAATQNKIVLMTIHQPRTDILELFDKIILLSSGKTLFYGTVDEALSHFDSLGFPLPAKTNPCDFFLDVITPDQRSSELRDESYGRIDKFYESWESKRDDISISPNETPVSCKIGWPSSWIGESSTLLERNLKDVSRDMATFGATVGQSLIISLLMGFLFWRMGLDEEGIQNRVGYFFFLCINSTFGFVMPIIGVFPEQRTIMKRERASGTYRASSAYIAKAISSVPMVLVGVVILAIPSYWMIGLQRLADRYFVYVLILLVHALTANALGLAIGSAVPTATVGNIVAPLVVVLFLLFGGLFVNLNSLTVVLQWIQYISPIAYSNKAFNQNEFRDLVFDCTDSEACYSTGEQVLSGFGYDNLSLWTAIGINLALLAAYTTIGFAFFQKTSRPDELLEISKEGEGHSTVVPIKS